MSSEAKGRKKCVNNEKVLSEVEKSNWVIGLVGGRCKHVVFPAKIPEGAKEKGKKEGTNGLVFGQLDNTFTSLTSLTTYIFECASKFMRH